MDAFDRLDPALQQLAPARTDLSLAALTPTRESLNQRRRETALSVDVSGVDVVDDVVGSVPVRIYRGARLARATIKRGARLARATIKRGARLARATIKHGSPAPAPAVVYCHSGAFVLGNLDTDHRQCVEFVRRGRCTVISVDYRLSPENPYPAALDDATTVLVGVAENAGELGVEATRLAVAGSSAGAALAAGMAQRAAAGAVPSIVFQLLHQPVLDDRPTGSKEEFVDTPGFDGPATQLMWRHYLAGAPATSAAVPARSDELRGVASAFISCSELDPLRDEALDYARRLSAAGGATELHVFDGTCHGFDSLLPEWHVSQQLFELQGTALRRALSC